MHLRRPDVAHIVAASIQKGAELGHYDLDAWVIMANHVHLLIHPRLAPERLLKLLKGASARECNKILGLTGSPFWQRESYDHVVRNRDEWHRIKIYIENNPVKASLVRSAEDYQWSSAHSKVNAL